MISPLPSGKLQTLSDLQDLHDLALPTSLQPHLSPQLCSLANWNYFYFKCHFLAVLKIKTGIPSLIRRKERACVLSHSVASDPLRPHRLQPTRLLCPWGSSRQEYWSGLPALLQGIFPTQVSNPGLPHCRQILHYMSHQGHSINKYL